MTISPAGIAAIKKHEGLRLVAYQDSVGIWTIGYGNIRYIDGKRVKKGDRITQVQADKLFDYFVTLFAYQVDELVQAEVSQNQFDALISLAYNIGIGGFRTSTVLRRVNADPQDILIGDAFMMWNKGTIDGKRVALRGLTNRRREEVKMYFS